MCLLFIVIHARYRIRSTHKDDGQLTLWKIKADALKKSTRQWGGVKLILTDKFGYVQAATLYWHQ
jgi:hypothetical protein